MKRTTQILSQVAQPAVPRNTIVTSDCVAFMAGLPDACVDLTVTSPPYDDLRDYDGYSFEFEKIADELYRVTKDGGVLVWVVGDRIHRGRSLTSFRQALYMQHCGFICHDVMIYRKKNTPFMRSNAYTNCYEFMLVMSRGRVKTFNPLKQKTVRHGFEMLAHNEGDLVFDPMCGAGTTPKMAALLGRDYLGVDVSAQYTELARKRIEGEVQLAVAS